MIWDFPPFSATPALHPSLSSVIIILWGRSKVGYFLYYAVSQPYMMCHTWDPHQSYFFLTELAYNETIFATKYILKYHIKFYVQFQLAVMVNSCTKNITNTL
jgi:hypothetical protein